MCRMFFHCQVLNMTEVLCYFVQNLFLTTLLQNCCANRPNTPKNPTSVRGLCLLLFQKIRNSRGSLCKSTTKVSFCIKSTSVFRLDN